MKHGKINKIKKRKWKFGGILIVSIVLGLISFTIFTMYSMPIKHIKILGTNLLSDTEIIEVANIKEYPEIYKISTNKLKSNIQSLDLVDSVNIKKKLNGTLIIDIIESKVLFYNLSTDKVVLSNKSEVSNNSSYMGMPTVINHVRDTIYEKLIDGLNEIDYSIIALIGEIEYSPFMSEDTIIDDTRFLLRMNDGNQVYVNIINISKLNNYREIFASLEEGNWRIYLDSSSNNVSIEPIVDIDISKEDDEDGED